MGPGVLSSITDTTSLPSSLVNKMLRIKKGLGINKSPRSGDSDEELGLEDFFNAGKVRLVPVDIYLLSSRLQLVLRYHHHH